ncbi:flagellar protein FliT [Sporosarcina sp. Te-1]|uniref:flagellar protein FliT n=1 Tax=Sporosarcina sp. Te-1 TaxID=2818390 RepID=UPI001AA00B8F|nr:flagellar protein FliT [Sporosarcina sp. Te-1]QTD41194.1 flagellar protein FliT [Sporosarcina sp. Te-1]
MNRWQDISKELLLATAQLEEDKRDAVIETVERLLNERDVLQKEILPPFTSEEEAVGRGLVDLEKQVLQSLSLYSKRIRADISATQSKKEHMKNYVNPYGKVARDGTFYDTKQ